MRYLMNDLNLIGLRRGHYSERLCKKASYNELPTNCQSDFNASSSLTDKNGTSGTTPKRLKKPSMKGHITFFYYKKSFTNICKYMKKQNILQQ